MKPASLCILLLFTSCTLLGSGDNGPDIPGKLVFSAEDSTGASQIFTMGADGSGLKQLTRFGPEDEAYMPAWSPDGSQIVFTTSLRSSSNGLSLYVMNADGSNVRALNERENSHIPSPGNNPQWSPDGSKIVFDRCVNCQIGTNLELFMYDIASDSVIRLTDNQTSESHPTWSPDGQRIAFASDRDYFDADTLRFRKDIYLISNDGSNLQRLTETGYARNPVWDPNKNSIVFRSSNSDLNLGLFQVDIMTKNVLEIENDLTGDIQIFPHSQSPNGDYILVTGRDQSEPQDFSIYFIDKAKNKSIQAPFGPAEIDGADWFIPNDN